MTELLPPLADHLQKNLIGKSKLSPELRKKCLRLQLSFSGLPDHRQASLYGFVGASDEAGLFFNPIPTITEVVFEYCTHEGIPMQEMVSKSRKAEKVQPRQIIQHFLAVRIFHANTNPKGIFKVSLQDVADIFEMKHCSVIHSRDTVQNSLDVNKGFKKYYEAIESHLCAKFKIK